MKSGYVYILTNKYNTTIYIGVTSNLQKRLYEHKNKLIDGFTKKYNLNKLVYFEEFNDISSAIEREKYLKHKKRVYKNELIKKLNPNWDDLGKNWDLSFD